MSATEPQTMALPSVIDLDVMDEVREWLVEATGHGNVVLGASEVERCATNALLMLVAASNTAKRAGFEVRLADPSSALVDAIDRLGMNEIYSVLIEGN